MRRGLTLIEVLLTILLSVLVISFAFGIARQATLMMERMSNRAIAWERGQNALSIIEPRALHAALGITYESVGDVFRRSFRDDMYSMNSPQPAQWTDRGPLQVWTGYPTLFNLAANDEGVFRGRGIAILYALPSALRAKIPDNAPIHMSEGESVKFELVPSEELTGITTRLPTTAKNDLRSWVTFPLMRLPVYAVYSAGELTVRMAGASGLSATLYPYDEMHYLRAERFYAQNGVMLSEALRTTWTNLETRLMGVLEMWFEWTPSKKLLEAWILSSGGRASSRRTARPKDWPIEAPWREEFEFHDVAVVRGSWLLKNM